MRHHAYASVIPWADRVEIRVVARSGTHALASYVVNEQHWVEVEPGTETPVYLSLPLDVAYDIVEAITRERNPDATADAVADARKTRDRLLAMIEKRWDE